MQSEQIQELAQQARAIYWKSYKCCRYISRCRYQVDRDRVRRELRIIRRLIINLESTMDLDRVQGR